MEQRDYNVMSEHGITDQEYADKFGLPQELVGSPEMNDWMMRKVYEDNMRDCSDKLIEEGYSREKAENECHKTAVKNKNEAAKLLKSVQKRRGY